jgi:hypothetical protein
MAAARQPFAHRTLVIPEGFEFMVKPWIENGLFYYLTETRVRMGPFRSMSSACDHFREYVADKLGQKFNRERGIFERADELSERRKELFDLMVEEAGEITQARSKLRRGGDRMSFQAPKHRPDGPTNTQLFKNEVMDMMVLIEIMVGEENLISEEEYHAFREIKLERLRRYTDLYRRPGEPSWDERLQVEDRQKAQDALAAQAQDALAAQAQALKMGYDEDHEVGESRVGGSVKRSHRAEGRNWID